MKTIFKIVLVVALVFTSNITAQTFDNNQDTTLSSFDTQSSEDNFLSNSNVNAVNTTAASNSVFITQVGDSNTIISATTSKDSNVTLIQNGNSNLTVLDLDSNSLKQTVIQSGDNNSFLDYSPFKTEVRNATINQTGNNQNLTMFGSNSLSEKIKVSMKGQSQSIIIRNF